MEILFNILFLSTAFAWPDWNDDAGKAEWATNCDYAGTNLYSKQSAGQDCSSICQAESQCDYFVWLNYNGGTCYLKSGQNLQPTQKSDGDAVCGYIVSRTGGGGGSPPSGGNPPSSGWQPDWQTDGNKCMWAMNCDYAGTNLYSKQSAGQDCSGICQAEPQCDYFVWLNYNGGTCYLKSGQNLQPTPKSDGGAVCGYILSRGSGGGTPPGGGGTPPGSGGNPPPSTGGYTLQDTYSGDNFFGMFNFFTDNDPTQGFVDYVSQSAAQQMGLIGVQNGQVRIAADSSNVPTGRGRASVRLESKNRYNSGLFLFDLEHMPTGPGTWPAFWTYGANWPDNGEVDVLEGVDGLNQNSFAMHTSQGCSMAASDSSFFTGHWGTGQNGGPSTDCYIHAGGQYDNQGCNIYSSDGYFGQSLNDAQGGVFAYEWDRNNFMKMWIFKRNAIPSDIQQGSPNPANWGNPMAFFRIGSNCPANKFNSNTVVINLTFCGVWAGSVYPGGTGACNDAVKNNPGSFNNAYWLINYLKVYQH